MSRSSKELISPDEVTFEANVFLLKRSTAEQAKTGGEAARVVAAVPRSETVEPPGEFVLEPQPAPTTQQRVTLRIRGTIPPEIWNRLGTKLLPKLRSGGALRIGVDFSATVDSRVAHSLRSELNQILDDLGLSDAVHIE